MMYFNCGVHSESSHIQERDHATSIRQFVNSSIAILFSMVLLNQSVEAGSFIDITENNETTDNGDGTYSFITAVAPKQSLKQGAILTWEYIGPADYIISAVRSSTVEYIARSETPITPVEQLLGTRRTDSLGRVWEVIDVDEEALMAAVVEESSDSYEDLINVEPLASISLDFSNPDEGLVVTNQYRTWTAQDCNADGTDDVRLWNGDSRIEVLGTPDVQEAAVVYVRTADPTLIGNCTGTILRDLWVLTAAHCVTDPADGTELNGSSITVYRLDDTESRGVDFVHAANGWNYTGHTKDYALLELSEPWSSNRSDMNLSAASNATIDGLNNPRNLGLPLWARSGVNGSCDVQNTTTDLFLNIQDEVSTPLFSSALYLKLDASVGHSGGPVYFCPQGNDDVCNTSDEANVIGVYSSWYTGFFTSTHAGPKVPTFRTWALGIMNN